MILPNYDFGKTTFQDPIHGSINCGPIEKEIIDHPHFQRLHGLRQNSLLYLVFPAANHTRFDHSLGAMFLADKFLDSIFRNQKVICEKVTTKNFPQEKYRINDPTIKQIIDVISDDSYFRLITRVAALLHDTGHGPFSHLFENFFPKGNFVFDLVSKEEKYSHLKEYFQSQTKSALGKKVEHEVFSCLIATKVIHDCRDIIKKYKLDPSNLAEDVCSIIEEKIPCSDQLKGFRYKIQPLFHQIVSGIIDVDRMDYLLRDSHMCGVSYGKYEPIRILKSMCAYVDFEQKELRVAIRHSALDALEDFLFSRYQMNKQIYGHKTNRACSAMLEKIREHLKNCKWSWKKECATTDDLVENFTRLNDSLFVRQIRLFAKRRSSVPLKELIENLFVKRKLLKRVYENIADKDDANFPKIEKKWERAKSILESNGIKVVVPDAYPNKGENLGLACPLKVLKKSATGEYLVYSLNEFQSLAQKLPQKEVIFRIFCKSTKAQDAKLLLKDNKLVD
ncbi:MAG: HD domain-containing protein [Nitrospinae bacterium]|nr:HD domain-containing protein [Nitrospinota bacterium]